MYKPSPSVIITGTGSYLPKKIVSNHDLAKIVNTSDEWISSRTGIRHRHFASKEEASSHMAVAAGEQAIARAKIKRNEIDLLIVATMTPDMSFPSTACLVQSRLGLENITAFDLQAACSGFIYALNTGSNMLRSGAFKKALIIGSDKMSSILDFEDRNTCVLFGDGASAVIIETTEASSLGILGGTMGSDGSNPDLLYQPAGGSSIPASLQSIEKRQHFIRMNGKEIFKQAVRVMEQVCRDTLEQHGYDAQQVNLLIPHQANMRIIESLAKRMNLPMNKIHNNLERCGNTSGASVGLVLDEALCFNRIKSGELVLLVAFGAGLTWGSTLIKWQ